MSTNYQLVLDKELASIIKSGHTPKLLLHSCCAPCSSYVLEYLSRYFDITVFYFNPNITDEAEYRYRTNEQQRLISLLGTDNNIAFVEGEYDPKCFFDAVRGFEDAPEGGERCEICFRLRLTAAADYAKRNKFDYFTTTLTISPLKNAQRLNAIGGELAEEYGIDYLYSDFKKKNGYKRSIELSSKYNLYRQDYCGCIFSKTRSNKK